MNLKPGFAFVPLHAPAAAAQTPPPVVPDPPYGPLSLLPGHWAGMGFNMIWRPYFDPAGVQNHFLELNVTSETIDFALIEGAIPNRGLRQADIDMFGLTYLQQISDANLSTPGNIVGLHAEPGVWANVPATTNPEQPATVVRMASIPHGAAIIAQGLVVETPGLPEQNEPASPYPFPFNPKSGGESRFPEADLSFATDFRSSGAQMRGITQDMLDRPVANVLKEITRDQTIRWTVTLDVSTKPTDPNSPKEPKVTIGGGVANTAFLIGAAGVTEGPNALATEVDATFWIQMVQGRDGAEDFLQLQYRQTVFLEFAGFIWPHVTVATLRKQP